MGVSINLYRLSKAENISEINNLETEIESEKESKVDLYKMTQDLAVIFLNSVDPFSDVNTIPYKMLFGNPAEATAGWRMIGGFIPSSEINSIVEWISESKVGSFEGFTEMYNNLSEEVKKELYEIGSPDIAELYNGYVRPLTEFYFKAHAENNSVVVSGE
jgi:hypothetical protein